MSRSIEAFACEQLCAIAARLRAAGLPENVAGLEEALHERAVLFAALLERYLHGPAAGPGAKDAILASRLANPSVLEAIREGGAA